MTWVLISVSFTVGFVCGACWMNARVRTDYNRRALQISNAVDEALSMSAGQSRGRVVAR